MRRSQVCSSVFSFTEIFKSSTIFIGSTKLSMEATKSINKIIKECPKSILVSLYNLELPTSPANI